MARPEKDPIYELTKTECLYVATKFNDEARARLILRWEQLENERQQAPQPQAAPQTVTPPLEINKIRNVLSIP